MKLPCLPPCLASCSCQSTGVVGGVLLYIMFTLTGEEERAEHYYRPTLELFFNFNILHLILSASFEQSKQLKLQDKQSDRDKF